ncbi:MAG: spermidine/putrescine ABC transporter substrate-binding protein [Elainellaceae cyanobacterium]
MQHRPNRPSQSSAQRSSRLVYPSRRRFLQASAAALSGVVLSNCRQNLSSAGSSDAEDGAASSSSGSSNTLHIYTWSGYTDDAMISAFTEKTGIDVVVDLYDSNETMLARMQAGGGEAYSIIYPSEYMVQEMMDLNMLVELDHEKLSNYGNIFFDQWQDPAYDPGNAHSIPFSWGTTGLLYNQAQLADPVADWQYLWEHQDALSNRMTLLDDMRETLGAALKSLGYSINSTDPAELEEAYQRLSALTPAIANFQSFGFEDQILGGDLLMVMSYSSDAIPVTLESEDLNYMVPESGASLWTDAIVIPKTAPNMDAAYEWINFLLDPDVAKSAVENLYFSTPITEAYQRLSDELKQNEDLFPPESVLANCEGLAPVDEATALYEQYWTQLTSG